MLKSDQSKRKNLKNQKDMYIKVKTDNVYVADYIVSYPEQCSWCGKTIKEGKKKFSNAYLKGYQCSLVHLKQQYKAEKGL